METLNRLVSESLARHGFDRPVDYRRLQWSRWFRCESHHSLLVVPSKPGVFALAEEVMNLASTSHPVDPMTSQDDVMTSSDNVEERRFSAGSGAKDNAALAAVSPETGSQEPKADARNRMLAVAKFFEDDDMAFVLDRMLSYSNPMRSRLASGRYFVRFVEIHDQVQRRSVCSALNQWIVSSAEKATGIGSHFATSLELTPAAEQTSVGRAPTPANAETGKAQGTCTDQDLNHPTNKVALLEAVAATLAHRVPLFPSGF